MSRKRGHDGCGGAFVLARVAGVVGLVTGVRHRVQSMTDLHGLVEAPERKYLSSAFRVVPATT